MVQWELSDRTHWYKTEAMLISSHAFTGPMRPFMIGNSYLNFTTKSTCLGVLNWKPQVEALCSKFRAKLKFLKRIKGLPSRVLEDIACRTGVIFLRFSGEGGQARGEHEVRDMHDRRGAKKITPVRQPLFMLFRPQKHPQITNQLQHSIKVARNGLSCFARRIQSDHQ